jgi:hypothetical protein
MAQYPHCNTTVIHAPGTCFYCDMHPKMQKGREASGEPFSPAEANGWSGNVAVKAGEIHSHMGATYVVGDDEDDDVFPYGKCDLPPFGFVCRLPRGHSGPCPAWCRWWYKPVMKLRTGHWWP